MQTKKVPMRKCTGCGMQKPKRELIRVVLNKEGEISLDATGKKPGRGSLSLLQLGMLEKSEKNRGLERGLSTRIDPEIYEKLEQEIHSYEAKAD